MKKKFTVRPFKIPQPVWDTINAGSESLTQIMHRHAGRLGDYDLAKAWEEALRKRANWVGNTIPFNYVVDYELRRRDGNQRYNQVMFEQDGVGPVGFLRLHHLSMDTQTRRRDCTKVEETLVSDLSFLRDTSLFKAMYDYSMADSARLGHARVITELGVGLSPQRYNGLARLIAKLSQKPERREEEDNALKQAQKRFEKNWVKATERFVDDIGFEITDIILPDSMATDSTPQIRISRTVAGADPLPLPPYQGENRTCYRYRPHEGLKKLNARIDAYRKQARKKYKLA